ncbi:MAG: glycosyltransferase, partial [Candidatus Andersenbacteria bacterium]
GMLTWLRAWDQLAAQRVDHFVANSYATARRISKYYGRASRVIYPPVEWGKFSVEQEQGDYYLMVGRFRPHKKFDLAIRAFNKLGLPLVILGSGEEAKNLRRIAGPNVTFVPDVTDEQTKARLFARAQALIHPQEEEFGIAAVESMAAGRPVVAYARGGALETVVPGATGVLFGEQSVDGLIDAVRAFEPRDYDPVRIREHARRFDVGRFQREIWQLLLEVRRERAQLPLPTLRAVRPEQVTVALP